MLPSAILKRRRPISRAASRRAAEGRAVPAAAEPATLCTSAPQEQGKPDSSRRRRPSKSKLVQIVAAVPSAPVSPQPEQARVPEKRKACSSESRPKRPLKKKARKKKNADVTLEDAVADEVAEGVSVASTKAPQELPSEDALPSSLSLEDLSKVQITGTDASSPALKPWMSFEDVRRGGPKGRLPAAVVAYMAGWKRFKEPTAIQAYCWPIVCAGRDIIGMSKTGSGKTLAYVLPCLSRILAFKSSNSISFGPYAVVLAPTRELATQIEKDARPLCRALKIRPVCVYGGAPKNEQIKALAEGADVVVATPGRLHDFAVNVDKFTGTSIMSLTMVSYVVLDEADCMLDLGFEPQIRKIFGLIDDERQTLFFSATWPKKVSVLADDFLRQPIHVRIGSSEVAGAAGNKDVEQRILVLEADETGEADRHLKKEELWRILSEHHGERCLVFCAMKKTAAVVAHQLSADGFKARGLHGDMTQLDRDAAMKAFKAGETKLLVATDVAARGLDVQGIAAVINYDPAAQIDDHIHRIGRTSRAGKTGVAYTLLGSADVRQAKYVAESIRSAGQEVPGFLAELAGRRLENAKTRKVANQRAKKKDARRASSQK